MKRIVQKKAASKLFCVILLFSALLFNTASAAGYEIQYSLPSEIYNVMNEENVLADHEIMAYAENTGSSKPWAFVAVQSDHGENLLYGFRKNQKEWKFSFKTSKAIPQGKGDIILRFDIPDELTVSLENETHAYWVKSTIFNLDSAGRWCLSSYTDRVRPLNVSITPNKITYYGGADLDEKLGSVSGTILTDMRYVSLASIPDTLKEAKNKYTVAPIIPQGELTAQNIKFTGGKKYDVYSGPGKDYARAANEKAVVSTNDWIQVFGKEDGWILIQYAISKEHMRFGWISEKALPKSAAVNELSFSPQRATLLYATAVTDDPLFSQSALVTLPQGATVNHLADMGDWAYVESSSGDLVRGFVNRDSIRLGMVYDLENHPSNEGTRILSGTITIVQNSIEVEIAPPLFGNNQGIMVSGFKIYDSIAGNLLLTVNETNASGQFVGTGTLTASTTSLRIVPIFSDNKEAGEEWSTILEW